LAIWPVEIVPEMTCYNVEWDAKPYTVSLTVLEQDAAIRAPKTDAVACTAAKL